MFSLIQNLDLTLCVCSDMYAYRALIGVEEEILKKVGIEGNGVHMGTK